MLLSVWSSRVPVAPRKQISSCPQGNAAVLHGNSRVCGVLYRVKPADRESPAVRLVRSGSPPETMLSKSPRIISGRIRFLLAELQAPVRGQDHSPGCIPADTDVTKGHPPASPRTELPPARGSALHSAGRTPPDRLPEAALDWPPCPPGTRRTLPP